MPHIEKFGLIGVTHPHSAAHLKTLNWIKQLTEVAVYDPDKSALREFREKVDARKVERVYTDLDKFLERDDVPVVFVCLRNDEAPAVITRAAEAGKHIIAEKPVARNAAELEPALSAVEKAGVKLTVCFQNRYHPVSQDIRKLLHWRIDYQE